MPTSLGSKILLAVVSAAATATLVGVGWLAGSGIARRPFRAELEAATGAATLGRLVGAEDRRACALAYHDPDEALRHMDEYSWDVPQVPAPFVGSMPRPGRNANAIINSMGFRSEREVGMPKPEGVFRVFLVGASTVFGSAAPDQARTVGGYLEAMLREDLSVATGWAFEVFTVAAPAWTSTHERIVIENRLTELDGDLVVILSGNNEVHWGRLGRNVLWMRTYSDELSWTLIQRAYASAGWEPPPEVVDVAQRAVPPWLVVRRLERNLRLAHGALRFGDTALLYVLQPNLQVSKKEPAAWERHFVGGSAPYFRRCYEVIDARLSGLVLEGFHYLDLSPLFDDLDASETVFVDQYHFGDKGYERVARAIADRIPPLVQPLRARALE